MNYTNDSRKRSTKQENEASAGLELHFWMVLSLVFAFIFSGAVIWIGLLLFAGAISFAFHFFNSDFGKN